MAQLRILHLEDDPKDQELVATILAREMDCDCAIEAVATGEAFTTALETCDCDVILLDYNVAGFDGVSALDLARKRFPDTPVILVSGAVGDELAADIIKRGAYDYVLKDRLARLPATVRRAMEDSRGQAACREAQEQLRISEAKYRTLIERMPAVTYLAPVADPGEPGALPPTVASYISPQLLDLIGMSAEEYLADPRPVTDYVHPDDRDRVMHAITRAWEDRQRELTLEYRIPLPSGETAWVRNEASVHADPSDGSAVVQGFIVDITQIKEAQEELRRANDELEFRVLARTADLSRAAETLAHEVEERRHAETRLDRAIRAAPLPTMLHAEDGRILLVNECWTRISGYSAAVIPTIADWTERAYGRRKDMMRSEIERLFDLDAPTGEIEDTITTRDGDVRVWALQSAPLGRDSSGRKLVITMGADVTERRQAERDLAAAKKAAEEGSVAKSRFLASMSHELRTPLGTIIGFAQLLKEKLFGDLNPKQEEHIDYVLESAQHLLSLINDILDLSKVEAGKMELRPSVFPLADLLDGSLVMFKEQCSKKEVRLISELGPDARAIVLTADERMLKQVMYNLLSNATKFTPRGGTVTVDAKADGDEVVISVSDTGIGIAPDQQQAVFDEFYQVRGGSTAKTPGTGLGLPLVRRMVDLHGGRVCLESEGEGKGCTFSFSIPMERPKEPGDNAPAEPSSSGRACDIIGTSLSRHAHACLCRFEPAEGSSPVERDALLRGLRSCKREDDVVVGDEDGRLMLLLSSTDRPDAETGCRRIVAHLESRLAVPLTWATAAFPEDGRSPEALLEVLQARIGGGS